MISILTVLAAMTTAHASEPVNESVATPAEKQVEAFANVRVGGEPEGELEVMEGAEGPLYRAGRVLTDTKLPVGYPAPTPPGAIEIKHYPPVRRAEYSSEGGMGLGGGKGFWPLFRHIQRNDIAMTAPVEMEYTDTDSDKKFERWTMAFLYHSTSDGPTGTDGSVEIVDTTPVTVVSLGIRGGSAMTSPEKAAKPLEEWLDKNSSQWRRAGDLRVLGYNGPNIRAANRWWEVQIPVVRVEAPLPSHDAAEATQ